MLSTCQINNELSNESLCKKGKDLITPNTINISLLYQGHSQKYDRHY